jgi:hypothetical protein
MIMDAVMYGVMFNASIDIFRNDPPVKASKRLNASDVVCCENQLVK